MLQHYYFPGELEYEIERFVEYYNNERYHELLNNITPADVYHDKNKKIQSKRDRIKLEMMKLRRFHNLKQFVTSVRKCLE